jgi:hypothetical protein
VILRGYTENREGVMLLETEVHDKRLVADMWEKGGEKSLSLLTTERSRNQELY